MSRIPVATELGRKDRFWPVALVSIGLHAAAIGLAVKATSLPTIELEQTPIRARLVRLGEKKPESYLPQKEAPPPPPAPAEPAPPVEAPPPAAEPPSSPPPALAPDAMPAAPTPAQPKPGPARPPRASPGRSPANGGGLSGVDAALARATKDVERTRYGDPEGDPLGDSDEGTEGEKYAALVKQALEASFHPPATISERERLFLQAPVTIWVEPDGTISNWKVTRSSGNPAFDAALERAIVASRLPPPPPELRHEFQNRGIPLLFKPKH